MSMSRRVDVAEGNSPRRRASADDIGEATQHLAALLHSIETGQLEMTPGTVRELQAATRVLEDLVEEAG